MSGQAKKDTAKLIDDPEIDARLGAKIREAYADVLDAPLPDRFLKLLDELEKIDDKNHTKAD